MEVNFDFTCHNFEKMLYPFEITVREYFVRKHRLGRKRCVRLSMGLFVLAGGLAACQTPVSGADSIYSENAQSLGPECASRAQAEAVQAYYRDTRPGAVLPIAGRKLALKEIQVAMGLALDQRILLTPDAEVLSAVLGSLRNWGADTNVRLVVSSKTWHPFDFPTKVPLLQDEQSVEAQFLDLFTADERSVRMHIDRTDLALLALFNLPGASDEMTRGLALYSQSGELVLSIYASQSGKPFDERAVHGFDQTWTIAAQFPQSCTSGAS